MKNIVLAVVLAFASTVAFADVTSTSGSSVSGTTAVGTAAGNATETTVNNNSAPIPSNTQVKMAPAIVAPALTTTLTETCLGSVSGGVSILGGGIAAGSTIKDTRCGNRLDARELHSWNEADVAKEIMCGTEEVRAAYKRVGRPCIEDQVKPAVAATEPKRVGTGVKDSYVKTAQ
jgi:hypothetical protein